MTQKKAANKIQRDKKAIVTHGEGGSNRTKLLIAAVIIVAVAAATGYYSGFFSSGPSVTATQAVASPTKANSNEIRFELAAFSDGKARYFSYDHNGKTIKYFILRSSDGVVRAAFDACDVCWPAGKGYVQEGDDMVCRNCGRRFASVQVNEVQGGCNPAPLLRTVEGNQLVIHVTDIVDGQRYFDYKGKA